MDQGQKKKGCLARWDNPFPTASNSLSQSAPGKAANHNTNIQSHYLKPSHLNLLASFGLSCEDLEELSHYPDDQLTPENMPLLLQAIQKRKLPLKVPTLSLKVREKETVSSADGCGPMVKKKVIDYGHKSKYDYSEAPIEVNTSSVATDDSMKGFQTQQPASAPAASSSGISNPKNPTKEVTQQMGSQTSTPNLQAFSSVDSSKKVPIAEPAVPATAPPMEPPRLQPLKPPVGPPIVTPAVIQRPAFPPIVMPAVTQHPAFPPIVMSAVTQRLPPFAPEIVQILNRQGRPELTPRADPPNRSCQTTDGQKGFRKEAEEPFKTPFGVVKASWLPVLSQTDKQKVKKLPTPSEMNDYFAVTPRIFPHICSLCDEGCMDKMVWIQHQNTLLHSRNCHWLLQRYPDWTPETPSSPKRHEDDKQETHQSRQHSGSPSPKRSRHSSSGHDRPRSQSRQHSSSPSPERSRHSNSGRDRYRSCSRSRQRSNSPSPTRSRHSNAGRDRRWSRSRSRQRSGSPSPKCSRHSNFGHDRPRTRTRSRSYGRHRTSRPRSQSRSPRRFPSPRRRSRSPRQSLYSSGRSRTSSSRERGLESSTGSAERRRSRTPCSKSRYEERTRTGSSSDCQKKGRKDSEQTGEDTPCQKLSADETEVQKQKHDKLVPEKQSCVESERLALASLTEKSILQAMAQLRTQGAADTTLNQGEDSAQLAATLTNMSVVPSDLVSMIQRVTTQVITAVLDSKEASATQASANVKNQNPQKVNSVNRKAKRAMGLNLQKGTAKSTKGSQGSLRPKKGTSLSGSKAKNKTVEGQCAKKSTSLSGRTKDEPKADLCPKKNTLMSGKTKNQHKASVCPEESTSLCSKAKNEHMDSPCIQQGSAERVKEKNQHVVDQQPEQGIALSSKAANDSMVDLPPHQGTAADGKAENQGVVGACPQEDTVVSGKSEDQSVASCSRNEGTAGNSEAESLHVSDSVPNQGTSESALVGDRCLVIPSSQQGTVESPKAECKSRGSPGPKKDTSLSGKTKNKAVEDQSAKKSTSLGGRTKDEPKADMCPKKNTLLSDKTKNQHKASVCPEESTSLCSKAKNEHMDSPCIQQGSAERANEKNQHVVDQQPEQGVASSNKTTNDSMVDLPPHQGTAADGKAENQGVVGACPQQGPAVSGETKNKCPGVPSSQQGIGPKSKGSQEMKLELVPGSNCPCSDIKNGILAQVLQSSSAASGGLHKSKSLPPPASLAASTGLDSVSQKVATRKDGVVLSSKEASSMQINTGEAAVTSQPMKNKAGKSGVANPQLRPGTSGPRKAKKKNAGQNQVAGGSAGPLLKPRVWICGPSVVASTQQRAVATGMGSQLGLEKSILLEWHGQEDVKWDQLLPFLQRLTTQSQPPDVLIVQLGEEDLANAFNLGLLVKLKKLFYTLTKSFPTVQVFWSEMMPWVTGHKGGDWKWRQENHTLGQSIKLYGGDVIKHPRIKSKDAELYYDKGNLSNAGLDMLLEDIKSGILAYLRQPRRADGGLPPPASPVAPTDLALVKGKVATGKNKVVSSSKEASRGQMNAGEAAVSSQPVNSSTENLGVASPDPQPGTSGTCKAKNKDVAQEQVLGNDPPCPGEAAVGFQPVSIKVESSDVDCPGPQLGTSGNCKAENEDVAQDLVLGNVPLCPAASAGLISVKQEVEIQGDQVVVSSKEASQMQRNLGGAADRFPPVPSGGHRKEMQTVGQKPTCAGFRFRLGSFGLSSGSPEHSSKPRVWICGDSVVVSAQKRASSTPAGSQLGLEQSIILEWHGQENLKWIQLLPFLKKLVTWYQAPDVLVIHLGEKDLARAKEHNLFSRVQKEWLLLRTLFSKVRVMWSAIIPQSGWDDVEHFSRLVMNHTMESCVRKLSGYVIHHPRISSRNRRLYIDGVNLSSTGLDIFLEDMRRGILAHMLQYPQAASGGLNKGLSLSPPASPAAPTGLGSVSPEIAAPVVSSSEEASGMRMSTGEAAVSSQPVSNKAENFGLASPSPQPGTSGTFMTENQKARSKLAVGSIPLCSGSAPSLSKPRVWICGHSLIAAAQKRADTIENSRRLGLEKEVALEWHVKKGMMWLHLIPFLQDLAAYCLPPDVLIIHLGENDLMYTSCLEFLLEIIRTELFLVKELFPNVKVVWSDMLPLSSCHEVVPDAALKDMSLRKMNHDIGQYVKEQGGAVIKHPRLSSADPTLYLSKATLSYAGFSIFLEDIRSGIVVHVLQSHRAAGDQKGLSLPLPASPAAPLGLASVSPEIAALEGDAVSSPEEASGMQTSTGGAAVSSQPVISKAKNFGPGPQPGMSGTFMTEKQDVEQKLVFGRVPPGLGEAAVSFQPVSIKVENSGAASPSPQPGTSGICKAETEDVAQELVAGSVPLCRTASAGLISVKQEVEIQGDQAVVSSKEASQMQRNPGAAALNFRSDLFGGRTKKMQTLGQKPMCGGFCFRLDDFPVSSQPQSSEAENSFASPSPQPGTSVTCKAEDQDLEQKLVLGSVLPCLGEAAVSSQNVSSKAENSGVASPSPQPGTSGTCKAKHEDVAQEQVLSSVPPCPGEAAVSSQNVSSKAENSGVASPNPQPGTSGTCKAEDKDVAQELSLGSVPPCPGEAAVSSPPVSIKVENSDVASPSPQPETAGICKTGNENVAQELVLGSDPPCPVTCEQAAKPRVWICGDSLVVSAQKWDLQKRQFGQLDCLQQSMVLEWHGQEGLTWAELVPMLQKLAAQGPAPDVLIIHLGEKELLSTPWPELGGIIKKELVSLKEVFPKVRLMWSEMLPQNICHPEGDACYVKKMLHEANVGLGKLIFSFGGVVIKHGSSDLFPMMNIGGGGLSHIGLDVFLEDIKNGIRARVLQSSGAASGGLKEGSNLSPCAPSAASAGLISVKQEVEIQGGHVVSSSEEASPMQRNPGGAAINFRSALFGGHTKKMQTLGRKPTCGGFCFRLDDFPVSSQSQSSEAENSFASPSPQPGTSVTCKAEDQDLEQKLVLGSVLPCLGEAAVSSQNVSSKAENSGVASPSPQPGTSGTCKNEDVAQELSLDNVPPCPGEAAVSSHPVCSRAENSGVASPSPQPGTSGTCRAENEDVAQELVLGSDPPCPGEAAVSSQPRSIKAENSDVTSPSPQPGTSGTCKAENEDVAQELVLGSVPPCPGEAAVSSQTVSSKTEDSGVASPSPQPGTSGTCKAENEDVAQELSLGSIPPCPGEAAVSSHPVCSRAENLGEASPSPQPETSGTCKAANEDVAQEQVLSNDPRCPGEAAVSSQPVSIKVESSDVDCPSPQPGTSVTCKAENEDVAQEMVAGSIPPCPGNPERASKQQVWICGQSVVASAEKQASSSRAGSQLGLEETITLEWHGQEDLTWARLVPTLRELAAQGPAPDVLIIHLGEKDLECLRGAQLNAAIKTELALVKELFPQVRILWSNLLLRRRGSGKEGSRTVNRARTLVNLVMGQFIATLGGAVIEHPEILHTDPDFYTDGDNLSCRGLNLFLEDIKCGILAHFHS